ncbi:hypothetical protein DDZ13_14755 [Coraliomargarita sinensis]|uniref:Uncharacterized protein n=1 Tax=Coraliomargarita sinensis TaxID=2174842 RepID=A0A317ZE16_9BACT|nr:hypothetical protein [Coraliomargarita sinensis]PXA02912.1 hypothetical protein DDZ13_14755 [Coraliomargarita sinensis]
MHPDDDPQTTLSKWPFILGDVLLVATALSIAVLGGWQLTNWQVGACVAAVALGAGLFVLPYVVEFKVRVREEREDREADLRILQKHILNAEQEISGLDARMRGLEDSVSQAGGPNAALTEVIDQKIKQLEEDRRAQEKVVQDLQEEFKALPKEVPPAFDPEVLEPIEKRLAALEAKPKPEPAPKAVGPAPVETGPKQAEPAPSTGKTTPPAKPEKTVAQIERPKRSARERHGPEEARLLQRAITDKGDNSSAAVSRIIESKAKEQAAKPSPEAKAPEPVVEEPEPEVEEKEAEQDSPPSETPEATEGKVPAEEKASSTEEEARPEKENVENRQVPDETHKAPEAGSAGMLFDEEKITSPVTRTKAKKNDAVLTASVFIGIGNKPYLRGSGGGLNWDKGVVMEFQEIGKWRWVAPSDLDAAIDVQIYRNDEDPDKSGKYTVEPGQKLEVSPVF